MSLPAASSNGGNTIAVGNLTDLAGILANLSPEQLQNIQLDPVLFEALSKNIEPTTVRDIFSKIVLLGLPTINIFATGSIKSGMIWDVLGQQRRIFLLYFHGFKI